MRAQLSLDHTCTEIIPGLFLGRAGDTVDTGYHSVICATRATCLHASFCKEKILEFPIIEPDTEVNLASFLHDGQRVLLQAVQAIDDVLEAQERVLVCCGKGDNQSALVVLAYIVAKHSVSPQQAYNFVQLKRPVVCTKENHELWDF